MAKLTSRIWIAGLAALFVGSLGASMAAAARSDLDTARAATARFNSVRQAEAAGYGLLPEGAPLHECIESLDGSGSMGFHLIDGTLLDGTVEPARPEALVYAPDANGKLKLVALEYVVFASAWTEAEAPELFGTPFMFTDEPNRYDIPAFWALHVWLWEENPSGLFAGFSPTVSCH
jgi:hypothetical protein